VLHGITDLSAHQDSAGHRCHGQLGDQRWIGQDPTHLEAPIDDRLDDNSSRRNIPPQQIRYINNKRRSLHQHRLPTTQYVLLATGHWLTGGGALGGSDW